MTILYDLAISGGSTANIGAAVSLRYGIQLNGAGGVLVGKNISTFSPSLRKTGTTSGNITCTVRDSADTVRATFQETLDSNTLPTSFAKQLFTLASPITLANGDRILVEFGGTGTVTVDLYATDQFDGALTRRTRFQTGAYSESSTADIAGTITDGTFFSQTYTHKYNIRQLATQTYTHKYNIRKLVTQTYTHLYKIRQLATQTFTHKYKIRQLASQTFTHIYNILAVTVPLVALNPSFSAKSFSPLSFTIAPTPSTGGGSSKKRNRFRAWIASWARPLKEFFKIKPRPPEPEEVEIPPAQPPAGKKVTILAEPPTKENPISMVASIPSEPFSLGGQREHEQEPEELLSIPPVYPLILNPLTSPLIQTRVTLPRATRTPLIPPYRVGEGSHIESAISHFKKPRNRSKTASTINTLMILLEIESKI